MRYTKTGRINSILSFSGGVDLPFGHKSGTSHRCEGPQLFCNSRRICHFAATLAVVTVTLCMGEQSSRKQRLHGTFEVHCLYFTIWKDCIWLNSQLVHF